MKKIHGKIQCCGKKIWHIGERRRQCSGCGKKWRVRKKKRGRKQRRTTQTSQQLLHFFQRRDGSLKSQINSDRITAAAHYARMRLALAQFNRETPWPEIPSGPLIAVADAFNQRIRGRRYTVYVILLKRVGDQTAVITPPLILPGAERVRDGWVVALNRLPSSVQACIQALVCDGVPGLIRCARQRGWKIQRCHFHLLARIEHYASTGHLQRNAPIGREIRRHVQTAITSSDLVRIRAALEALRSIQQTGQRRWVQRVISGFFKHLSDYRSYTQMPGLPTTSNSIESLFSQVRDLQGRARGFSSIASFTLWLEAYLKFKKTKTCKGAVIHPN